MCLNFEGRQSRIKKIARKLKQHRLYLPIKKRNYLQIPEYRATAADQEFVKADSGPNVCPLHAVTRAATLNHPES